MSERMYNISAILVKQNHKIIGIQKIPEGVSTDEYLEGLPEKIQDKGSVIVLNPSTDEYTIFSLFAGCITVSLLTKNKPVSYQELMELYKKHKDDENKKEYEKRRY